MEAINNEGQQARTLFSIDECALRWGVSSFSVRRRADAGQIKTLYVGARRLVPRSEVDRVEEFGLPRARATDGGPGDRNQCRGPVAEHAGLISNPGSRQCRPISLSARTLAASDRLLLQGTFQGVASCRHRLGAGSLPVPPR